MTDEAWQTGESRRAQRREARAPSTLRTGGPGAIDVTVLDISDTGLRLTAPKTELTPGQEISIGLSGCGTRRAFVAWRREDEYGCQFDEPLTAEETAVAFAGASVIAIGPSKPLIQAPVAAAAVNPMAGIYDTHRVWALPLDAVIALVGFVGVCGTAFWMLVRG